MRLRSLVSTVILLAVPTILAAQDSIKVEVGASGAFLLEKEHSDFFNGYLLTGGISYRGLGIQWEGWFSGDEQVSGLSLVLSPFYRSKFSLCLLSGVLAGSEGGWVFSFGGGLKIMLVKILGLRAEIRFFGPGYGAISGGIFIRL